MVKGRQAGLVSVRRQDDGLGCRDAVVQECMLEHGFVVGAVRQFTRVQPPRTERARDLNQGQVGGVGFRGAIQENAETDISCLEAGQHLLQVLRGNA